MWDATADQPNDLSVQWWYLCFFMFVRLLILISHCLFKANIFPIVRLISCLFERSKERDGGEQTRRQTLSYHTTTHRHAPLHTYTHSHKFSKEKKANVNTHTHINTRKYTQDHITVTKQTSSQPFKPDHWAGYIPRTSRVNVSIGT